MISNLFKRFKDRFMENCIPTEEELASRYREMSDTAFRMIETRDLTPLARKCHAMEEERRFGKRCSRRETRSDDLIGEHHQRSCKRGKVDPPARAASRRGEAGADAHACGGGIHTVFTLTACFR
jgi:hypothetical protein